MSEQFGVSTVASALGLTTFIISDLPVDKQNEEIGDVKVSDGCIKSGWEGPCKAHKQVTADRVTDV